MTKVLPLSRWKKDLPEQEAFSDEDSDEEDSEYEEILIPEKKDVKRKREANEVANSKRIKPNLKPQIRILKKSVRPCQAIKRQKKRPRVSVGPPGPPSGPPPKRFKPNQSKPSSIPSRR